MDYIKEYEGPILTKDKMNLKFWNKDQTIPLGGLIRASLVREIDGDTAMFLLDNKTEMVRFFIIDTPELRPNIEDYAQDAKEFTGHYLHKASEIYLESDINDSLRDNTDSKRLLAWIWVDGKLLNYLLVRNGLATVRYISSPKMKYLSALNQANELAKCEKRGLYQNKEKPC